MPGWTAGKHFAINHQQRGVALYTLHSGSCHTLASKGIDNIGLNGRTAGVDNKELIIVNDILRSHPVEKVGAVLRKAMTDMKVINTPA